MTLIKSKQRVADHGEVFTPIWLVEAMLDLVKDESERINSRFLEPACGSGNFLTNILKRKLAAVELKYGKSDFARSHYALLGLMCIYGIELLADNIDECHANLLEIFAHYLDINESDEMYRAASYVLSQNIVHGIHAWRWIQGWRSNAVVLRWRHIGKCFVASGSFANCPFGRNGIRGRIFGSNPHSYCLHDHGNGTFWTGKWRFHWHCLRNCLFLFGLYRDL